jgi:uncharacterized protein YndB with AHSA1/START domain
MEQAKLAEKPSLTLTRSYAVAPEQVWRALTDAEAVKRWWGPGGNEPVSLAQLDVRAGGRFRIVFGGPELVFLHEQFFDEMVRDNHQRGWSESFAKLEHYLQQI